MPGTTAFPGAKDTFPTIDPNTHEDAAGLEHDVVHNNTMAAVAALQTKVGIDASTDADSLDARVAAVESGKLDASEVGVSVAELVAGLIPAGRLPSYVDDVLEFANAAAFPTTGESGKIYIAIDTAAQYRWTGTAYMQLVASPGTTDALTEGTGNLYFTAQRVRDAVLSGLSTATNAVISATDSILSALGKLQAQVSALAASLSGKADTSSPLSQFAATTSAQLAAVISDETGSGAAVFASAPTLVNPVVGTQAPGDNSTKAASTAFVAAAVTAGGGGGSAIDIRTIWLKG